MIEYITVADAAKLSGTCRQAVYLATRKGLLKSQKSITNRVLITRKDLEEYRANRYKRENTMINGEPLFDVSQGTYSLRLAAEYLGIEYISLYHYVRKGTIKAIRKRAAWIFHKDDLDNFKKFLDRKARQIRVV